MSTRGSIQYLAIGSYRWRTEFSWHVYHECRDGTYHLELTMFGYPVVNVVLPRWARRALGVRT